MPALGTQYPIKDGTVYIFKKVVHRQNDKLGVVCNHWRVIWVMRVFKLPKKHKRAQDQKVRRFIMDIPVLVGQHHKCVYNETVVAMRTLTKFLTPDNHEILSTECPWQDREGGAKRFYQIVEGRLNINLI